MKFLKDYKGVAIIYVIVTLVNVLWVVNYDKPDDVKRVQNESVMVMNS